jgi:hypothetical protein
LASLRPLYPLLLLAGTALIYGALDPNFGFNDSSLVLLLALMAGLTLTTYLFDGFQVLFSKRAFGIQGAIKAYPVAIVIAAVSVCLSRLVDLNPGVIFGFVAAAALAEGGLGRRERGLTVFLSMLALLTASLIALALISPLRSWAEGQSGVWATLPETIAVAVFVGGAETVLLALIPLTFTEGEKVWAWNRPAWLFLALPATFLFFHVIVNRNGTFDSISDDGGAITPLLAAIAFLVIATSMWGFFHFRNGRMAVSAAE